MSFKSHLKDLLSLVWCFPNNCLSTYRTNFFKMHRWSKTTYYEVTRAIFKKVLLGNCDQYYVLQIPPKRFALPRMVLSKQLLKYIQNRLYYVFKRDAPMVKNNVLRGNKGYFQKVLLGNCDQYYVLQIPPKRFALPRMVLSKQLLKYIQNQLFKMHRWSKTTSYEITRAIFKKVLLGNCDQYYVLQIPPKRFALPRMVLSK